MLGLFVLIQQKLLNWMNKYSFGERVPVCVGRGKESGLIYLFSMFYETKKKTFQKGSLDGVMIIIIIIITTRIVIMRKVVID